MIQDKQIIMVLLSENQKNTFQGKRVFRYVSPDEQIRTLVATPDASWNLHTSKNNHQQRASQHELASKLQTAQQHLEHWSTRSAEIGTRRRVHSQKAYSQARRPNTEAKSQIHSRRVGTRGNDPAKTSPNPSTAREKPRRVMLLKV